MVTYSPPQFWADKPKKKKKN